MSSFRGIQGAGWTHRCSLSYSNLRPAAFVELELFSFATPGRIRTLSAKGESR
jgi:hypothetical protein